MAIDTKEKRASVAGVGRPWYRTKLPSATFNAPWRWASGNAYSGVAPVSITVTPAAAASAAANTQNPTVVLGGVTVTPAAAASAAANTQNPTVQEGGDLTVVPAGPAAAAANTQAPTIILGSVTLTPAAPAAGAGTTTGPSVVLGSLAVAPAASAAAAGNTQNPTVDEGGGLTVVPAAAAAAAGNTQAPIVNYGSVTVLAGNASAVGLTVYTPEFTGVIPAPQPVSVNLPDPVLRAPPKKSVRDFILSDKPLTESFRRVARERIKQLAGDAIFNFDRRPLRNTSPLAITLSNANGLVLNSVSQVMICNQPTIDVTVWSTDRAEPGASDDLIIALQTLFHLYRGPLSDRLFAETVVADSEPYDQAIAPIDGTDDWVTRQSMSFLVAVREMTTAEKAAYQAAGSSTENTQLEYIKLDSQSGVWINVDAMRTADLAAIGNDAWAVGENATVPETIYAVTNVKKKTYKAYMRYRYGGASPGNGGLHFDQSGVARQTKTIAAVTPNSIYEGPATVLNVAGYYDLGNVSLNAGAVTITVEGPSTPGDTIYMDDLVLAEQA